MALRWYRVTAGEGASNARMWVISALMAAR
jgi:hypothetical protein